MSTARDLLGELNKKSQFEPVDLQESAAQIRIMGRVRADGTNANVANWLLLVRNLLIRVQVTGCPWRADVSKSYFLKGEKVVYGWRLVLQAPGLDVRTCIPDMISTVRGAPQASHVSVEEVPLVGASPNRNSLNRGKGAGSVLNAPPIASIAGRNFGGS